MDDRSKSLPSHHGTAESADGGIRPLAPAASSSGPEPVAPDIDIGDLLRSIRRIYGLSQRELAKRAGVTNGTISLIEQNSVSPTIASLRKVLAGFPISLADFFAGAVPQAPKVFFTADELVRIRGGSQLEFRQVGPATTESRLQVLHEHYAPGGDTGAELLSHDGEEAGVIIRGRIEITVGGQAAVLGPGDAYSFDSRIPHRFRSIGDEPGEIVSACTPPTF